MNHASQRLSTNEFSYYQNVRGDLAEYVEKGNHSILDVGCGAGYFGEFLKSHGHASKVVGIEVDTVAANVASTKLDCVLCANLNVASIVEVLKDFDKATFDYIVCADVLEHLIDPWTILVELATFLKPGGRIIISIPNVRHWSVWIPLVINGHWDYRESGIMDKTHLRFFTRESTIGLIEGAQLKATVYPPTIWRWSERMLNKFTLGLCEGWLASQWVLVGKVESS